MRKNFLIKISLILILFLFSSIASLAVGAYRKVGFLDVIDYILGNSLSPATKFVLEERLWRTLAAIVAGIGLSSAGATLQYVLRNPLADPYILGVAGGSGLGVLVAIAMGWVNPLATYLIALIGGLTAFALMIFFSSFAGSSPFSIILSGVAVGYLTWAASMIIMVKNSEKIAGGILWLFGTVAFSTRNEVLYSLALDVVALLLLYVMGRNIEKLMLGDEVAESIGVRVKRTRIVAVSGAALATTAAVALAGPIGFIGLVAPWAARELMGSLYIGFFTASILLGATLLVLSDIAVRAIFAPLELPLTSIVAIIGVPVMIYIIREMRRESI